LSILDEDLDEMHRKLADSKAPAEGTTRRAIWTLCRDGVDPKVIAERVSKSLRYVQTEIRAMQLSGALDPGTLRPRGCKEAIAGVAVRAETITVVTCPRCRYRFEVQEDEDGSCG
jgi:hypothetical protein